MPGHLSIFKRIVEKSASHRKLENYCVKLKWFIEKAE